MIEYLSEDEVYRVGMCIERAGLDFYSKMAEKADDAATTRVFQRLARDEKQHLAYFESMELATAGGMGSRPSDLDEDLSRYVCSIVDGGIFRSISMMESAGRRKFDAEKALELALGVEKDAVLYYSEALSAAKKKGTKDALARLVAEEKAHVVEITKRLENLRKRLAKKTK
jgi:rubrerythrin